MYRITSNRRWGVVPASEHQEILVALAALIRAQRYEMALTILDNESGCDTKKNRELFTNNYHIFNFIEGDTVKVGVIGLGSVGTAVYNVMSEHHPIVGFDIDGRGSFDEISSTNIVFICVPTNGLPNGNLDCGSVRSVCEKLSEADYTGLVVIKSTLHPFSMESLAQLTPNLDLVYMPEFLRERDAEAWFRSPDRLVVGGNHELAKKALDYFRWVSKDIPRLIMDPLEAEIAKLAHNAYIATKVTFTCEIERICQANEVDSFKVMEVIWNDRRIRNSAHLTPGLGGFDGKCVPKDTRSLRTIDVAPDEQSLLAFVLKNGTKERVHNRRVDHE